MSTSAPRTATVTDRLVQANRAYAARFTDPGMGARPGPAPARPGQPTPPPPPRSPAPARAPRPVRRVAVVPCRAARLDLHAALGLELGDCHTIRNAGGVVTDDTIRSLTISQRALG